MACPDAWINHLHTCVRCYWVSSGHRIGICQEGRPLVLSYCKAEPFLLLWLIGLESAFDREPDVEVIELTVT